MLMLAEWRCLLWCGAMRNVWGSQRVPRVWAPRRANMLLVADRVVFGDEILADEDGELFRHVEPFYTYPAGTLILPPDPQMGA